MSYTWLPLSPKSPGASSGNSFSMPVPIKPKSYCVYVTYQAADDKRITWIDVDVDVDKHRSQMRRKNDILRV